MSRGIVKCWLPLAQSVYHVILQLRSEVIKLFESYEISHSLTHFNDRRTVQHRSNFRLFCHSKLLARLLLCCFWRSHVSAFGTVHLLHQLI